MYEIKDMPVGKEVIETCDPNQMKAFSTHNCLALFLMIQAKKKKDDPSYISKYDAHLNVLPTDFKEYPVCFTEEEIGWLEGSAL